MFTNILSRRRTSRTRAESDAIILDVAMRAVADERSRRNSAFDTVLAEFARPRLTTETILDLHFAAVTA